MEFYKIKNKGLFLSNKFFQEDIVFIIDGIAGYIWKGKKAVEMDEITAKEIEKTIDEKFKGISFNLIKDLDIKNAENLKIAQIKREIIKRLPRSAIKNEIKNKITFKTRTIRFYEGLKEYDLSINFRKKIFTRLTLWKVSLFNSLIILLVFILMLDLGFFHFIDRNFLLTVIIICLLLA